MGQPFYPALRSAAAIDQATIEAKRLGLAVPLAPCQPRETRASVNPFAGCE